MSIEAQPSIQTTLEREECTPITCLTVCFQTKTFPRKITTNPKQIKLKADLLPSYVIGNKVWYLYTVIKELRTQTTPSYEERMASIYMKPVVKNNRVSSLCFSTHFQNGRLSSKAPNGE